MSQTAQPKIDVSGDDGPGLRWLFDILVHDRGASERAPLGDPEPRVVTELAAVPNGESCRFVVPAAPRVAAASLRAYNAMRPRPVALRRAGLSAAVRLGGAPALLRHRVLVRADPGASSEELADRYLVEHLRRLLDVGVLHLAAGISTYGPFAKPTLQLFDGAGRPIAYVKIGWNPATRHIVGHEAEILARWEPTSGVVVPRLIGRHDWHGRELAITAPLPAASRRVPKRSWPCVAGAKAVASTRGLVDLAIGSSPLLADADDTVAALAGHAAAAPAAAALDAVRSLADVVVPHGVAHGDWVPWNLAIAGEDLVVWDWEHAVDRAPLGFDLVHWAYQQRVVIRGEEPEAAFARVLDDTADVWPALGLSASQAAAAAAVHRYVITTREALPEITGDPSGCPPPGST